MIKFSIIVPIYNVEKHLTQCIESLINQTYKNIEIILVDDGSPDNSSQICDKFAAQETRIKVIHKENGGLVSARQVGVEIATGDYAVCVDGDDWIAIDYCEKIATVIEKHTPDIICFGYFSATEQKRTARPLSYQKGLYNRKDIENIIFPMLIQTAKAEYFSPSVWSKVFRMELYRQNQLNVDKRIGIAEDAACSIPCIYEAKSIYVMEDCLYYYRQNETSMTKSKKAFRWDVPKIFYDNIRENIDIDSLDFRQQLYRKVVHELFLVAVSFFNRREPYSVIKKDILTILEDELYQEAIKNARFTSAAGQLSLLSLRHKLIFLLYCYNKVK